MLLYPTCFCLYLFFESVHVIRSFLSENISVLCAFFGYFISQLLHFLDGFKIVELSHIFGVWFFYLYTLASLTFCIFYWARYV